MQYQITGTVKFDVDFNVHAESEESAKKLAKERLSDFYYLKSLGTDHYPETVEITLTVDEY